MIAHSSAILFLMLRTMIRVVGLTAVMACMPSCSQMVLYGSLVVAEATVNFTEFTGNFTEGTLNLVFSAPNGKNTDSMTIALTTDSNGVISKGDFAMDGSTNALTANLTFYTSGAPYQQAYTASGGTLRVTAVKYSGKTLVGMAGQFAVTFSEGGAGSGDINFVTTQ
jgi:hypothetical protein